MHPVFAWLPFLAALLVAFGAGVAVARINEGLTAAPHETPPPPGRLTGRGRPDVALSTALVAVLVGTLLVWLFVAVFVMHIK